MYVYLKKKISGVHKELSAISRVTCLSKPRLARLYYGARRYMDNLCI